MKHPTPKPTAILGERFRLSRASRETPFGPMWFARDQVTHKQVEVLFLTPDLVQGHEEAFRRGLAVPESPGAVQILHSSTDPPLRVTGWEKHTTLSDELTERSLLSTTAAWIAQVAATLEAAHAAEIVHGSISPASIWIVSGGHIGEARTTNWGLIHLLGNDDPTSSTGINEIGGVAWISPEYARGLPTTSASDVYGLGAVLYQCLSGEPPFGGPSMKIAAAHVTQIPPPPSSRHADIPPWMDELTLSMLAKDPDKRPSAAEVLERLSEGAKDLVDRAAREDRVTANAAPSRLPRVVMRGAHSTHVPDLEPLDLERPAADIPDQRLMLGLVAVVSLLLGVIVGIGILTRF